MATNNYYIERHPGDLVTAEDWNGLQVKIQEDMRNRIDTAKRELVENGVKRADNADKFDNRTPKNWADELDQRYAPRVHDHEGMANYRRYVRRLDNEEPFLLLEHGLGRFPLVDVYELLPFDAPGPDGNVNTKSLLYYGHAELDQLQNVVSPRRIPRRTLGTPWERLLTEVGVVYEDDDSLGDVVNDFLDAYFRLPAASDVVPHDVSRWIDSHLEDRTIADLKRRDEWDDIRWLVLPRKLSVALPARFVGDNEVDLSTSLDVVHLSYDAVAVRGPENIPNQAFIDLMILLRS